MKDTDSGGNIRSRGSSARTVAASNRNSRRKHGSRALPSRDREGLLESRIFPMFYSLRAREQSGWLTKGDPILLWNKGSGIFSCLTSFPSRG